MFRSATENVAPELTERLFPDGDEKKIKLTEDAIKLIDCANDNSAKINKLKLNILRLKHEESAIKAEVYSSIIDR